MAGALQRLTVVDLSSHLSGPYCAMLLADQGADVIKVEKPGGDEARGMPPFMRGESAPFMIWNRNKRSVVIDLKTEVGKAQLLDLIDKADVLIENFRPGTLDRLGLGWPSLRERNPRLIYAAISGFGQTGPYRARGGFDLITQGMSGLMSVCGPKEGPPHRLPIAISDVAAGMHLAVGILAALEARHYTGQGQKPRSWKLRCRWACMRLRMSPPRAGPRRAWGKRIVAVRPIRCSRRPTAGSRLGLRRATSGSGSATSWPCRRSRPMRGLPPTPTACATTTP